MTVTEPTFDIAMAASTALPFAGSATVPSMPRPTPTPSGGPEVVTSTALLRGKPYVQIEHNGALYQLRATKLGKLILTK
jgi:hemin uptake protein HemP